MLFENKIFSSQADQLATPVGRWKCQVNTIIIHYIHPENLNVHVEY